MFGPDFYPTPMSVGFKMLKTIKNKNAKHFCEPQAGKGDLAEVIRGERYSGHKVDCIEINPELVEILRGKDFPIVGFDWLTYSGVCYYDAIIMNPPFSNGAEHLLKAWDFMHNGEIACLLNQQTIENPCDADRRRLEQIIKEHSGTVENLGDCFRRSQRDTAVNVVMVHLEKKQAEDDISHLWVRDSEEKSPEGLEPEAAMLAVRDQLGNMEHYYNEALSHMVKGFEHKRRAFTFGKALGVSVGIANLNDAMAEFAIEFRKKAWGHVFTLMHFDRWLDKKQREAMLREIATSSDIPFTAENIRGTLDNIVASRSRLFEQSVANVFDELTKHFAGNTGASEGWKTNSDYMVNQKLVFPYGCRFDDDKHWREFKLWYGSSSTVDFYHDLDRVLCVMAGEDYEKCDTIAAALDRKFRILGHKVVSPFDNTAESRFFEIKFWMKGTVHLKWKDRDLWEKFNQKAAAGKRWVGRAKAK